MLVDQLYGDSIAWYENNGAANPSFTKTVISTGTDGANDVHVADIDGDGDLDIIAASGNDDEITWFENNGAADPTFATTVIATSADNPHEVFIADMDADGDLDIVSTSVNDSTLAGMRIMEQQILLLLQLISQPMYQVLMEFMLMTWMLMEIWILLSHHLLMILFVGMKIMEQQIQHGLHANIATSIDGARDVEVLRYR